MAKEASDKSPVLTDGEVSRIIRICSAACDRGEITIDDGRFVIKACGAWPYLERKYKEIRRHIRSTGHTVHLESASVTEYTPE